MIYFLRSNLRFPNPLRVKMYLQILKVNFWYSMNRVIFLRIACPVPQVLYNDIPNDLEMYL